MAETADRITLERMVQVTQSNEDAVGQARRIATLRLIQQEIILAGAVLHATETDDTLCHAVSPEDSRRRSTRYRLRGPSMSM